LKTGNSCFGHFVQFAKFHSETDVGFHSVCFHACSSMRGNLLLHLYFF
jgi:hypothetical protein